MKFIFNFKSLNKLTDIKVDKLDSEKASIVGSKAGVVVCIRNLAGRFANLEFHLKLCEKGAPCGSDER